MSARLRRLFSKLGTIILALLLASVIWIAATLQADPFTSVDLLNVPVGVAGQPPNTVLLQPIVESATVRIHGPASELRGLSTNDLAATVDLSAVPLDTRTSVPIQVKTENSILRVESVSPAQQTVYLEALQTVTMPVQIAVRGQVATGYELGAPVIIPAEVTVTGPTSILEQVAAVSGTLSIGGAREPVSVDVEVAPRDAKGNILADVQPAPAKVSVRAGVRKKVGFKPDVTVIPTLRGDPAAGYRRGAITVEPSTVTLAGTPSLLDKLPGFVRTQPITITGATQELVVRTTLTVPQSVVVVDAQFVTVTLEVLPIESSRIITSSIEVQGLGPGWAATLSPNSVQVILVGPDTVLAALKPGDVRVVVNLVDYSLGVHRIAPLVLPPEGVTVVSIIPQTIEVAIDVAPTPTPQPGPTPEPSAKP